jgi:hypothetical protein
LSSSEAAAMAATASIMATTMRPCDMAKTEVLKLLSR